MHWPLTGPWYSPPVQDVKFVLLRRIGTSIQWPPRTRTRLDASGQLEIYYDRARDDLEARHRR